MSGHRDHSIVTFRRQRVWIVGACAITALCLTPARASAGQLGAAPPTLPDESTPTPTPDVQADPTPAPSDSGGQNAPPPTGPTRADDRLSLEGRALWAGVQGKRVILDLKNGNELRGTVVAQDANNLAFARLSDGMIVSVPKSEIAGLRVRPEVAQGVGGSTSSVPYAERPRKNTGRGAIAGGVAMLALGVPLGVSGTAMLGVCAGFCPYIYLPLLLPGIGLIAGGSVALKRGHARDKQFRKAWGIPRLSGVQVTPTLAVSRGGGELGFTLQF